MSSVTNKFSLPPLSPPPHAGQAGIDISNFPIEITGLIFSFAVTFPPSNTSSLQVTGSDYRGLFSSENMSPDLKRRRMVNVLLSVCRHWRNELKAIVEEFTKLTGQVENIISAKEIRGLSLPKNLLFQAIPIFLTEPNGAVALAKTKELVITFFCQQEYLTWKNICVAGRTETIFDAILPEITSRRPAIQSAYLKSEAEKKGSNSSRRGQFFISCAQESRVDMMRYLITLDGNQGFLELKHVQRAFRSLVDQGLKAEATELANTISEI